MFTLILVRRGGARQVRSPRAATSDQPVPRAFRIWLNSPSLRGRCTPTIPPHLAPLSSEDGVLNFHPAPLLEQEGKTKNPIKKLKHWKQNQRELGEEHRGAMQAKPVRTAVWMKDKVEAGVHSVKDRFSMEAQQPDVETEV